MNVDHCTAIFSSFNFCLIDGNIGNKNKYTNILYNGNSSVLWLSMKNLVNFIRRLNKN